jgi:acyl transferase domain-containing protein
MRSPDYWVDQVRRTVRFADAVTSLHTLGARTLLELGPTGVLTIMARDSVPETTELVAGLRAKLPEPIALITAMARLHARGIAVDWAALLPGGRSVSLPTYAFQHRRYWPQADDTAGRGDTSTSASPARLPALDATVDIPDITGAASTESTLATQVRNSIPAVGHRLVLHLVRTVAATVLGYGTADAIEVDTEFHEYGLDSLTAIELRNQLQEMTGLSLETTLAFDYSTSTELAHHLHAALTSDPSA